MTFLIVGLGSMGKRRLRNLRYHGISPTKIYGCDPSLDRRAEVEKEHQIQTFADFEAAAQAVDPDVYIISTPPHLHAPYFLYAARHKKHFFVEVATTDKGYRKLYSLLDDTFVAAPSFTFRYYQPVKKIKQLLTKGVIGQVWAFTHHLGQYLPDWHPWENYRTFYGSQPASSACREMVPYELQWLQWLLNEEFVSAKGITAKCSDLKLRIDDTYAASLKTKSGVVGTMMVEVIAQPAIRVLRLLGSQGTLEWDWQRHSIRYYQARKNKWTQLKLSPGTKLTGYKTTTEEMYQDEMGDFLSAVKGEIEYPYTFARDHKNFRLLKRIEKNQT